MLGNRALDSLEVGQEIVLPVLGRHKDVLPVVAKGAGFSPGVERKEPPPGLDVRREDALAVSLLEDTLGLKGVGHEVATPEFGLQGDEHKVAIPAVEGAGHEVAAPEFGLRSDGHEVAAPEFCGVNICGDKSYRSRVATPDDNVACGLKNVHRVATPDVDIASELKNNVHRVANPDEFCGVRCRVATTDVSEISQQGLTSEISSSYEQELEIGT